MKTSKITHEARLAIREGRYTGYTLGAQLVAMSRGGVSLQGTPPNHWFPVDPLDAGRPIGQTEDGERFAIARTFGQPAPLP